jgi:DNA-directed RNA polymerase subunit RPC12/RpoP
MAIICPKCKHQYDVTLFQFGSVVECDCGARIKFDPRKGIVLERQNIKNKEEDSEQSRTGK